MSEITTEHPGIYDSPPGPIRARAAGCPGSAHGLRKAGATRAANNGATERQLNAIFGWAEGSSESKTYTKNADRRRLARDAIGKLMG